MVEREFSKLDTRVRFPLPAPLRLLAQCKLMKYFVYIVRCKDNYLYTGLTSNLERRIDQHRSALSSVG